MTDTAPLRILYVDDDEMALTLTQLHCSGGHCSVHHGCAGAVSILSTSPSTSFC